MTEQEITQEIQKEKYNTKKGCRIALEKIGDKKKANRQEAKKIKAEEKALIKACKKLGVTESTNHKIVDSHNYYPNWSTILQEWAKDIPELQTYIDSAKEEQLKNEKAYAYIK
jgi:phage/plasmid-associated DNA primase